MITLVVTMSLLIFVTPFITLLTQMEALENQKDYVELQIGKRQLDHDIKKMRFKEIKDGKKLRFFVKPQPNKSDVVEYNHYNDMLRQTPGHQPLIQEVVDVGFTEYEEMIKMTITLTGGDTFVYFLDKGGL
ncbi:ComGF family competence protein [Vagococcus jeotgali]|uniref:ComGF family competence protein n=1 Tax=Vagococcus jeotgali TaxID=3109030 RepID=UPI002DDC17D7|nr:ComGF family competence protein [Vagococcus sp. B2T-5]